MPEYNEGDLVEVWFYDHKELTGWTPIKEVRDMPAAQCKVTGYFISENELFLRILYMVSDDKECSGTVIVKGCIFKPIHKIEESELDDFD